MPRQSQPANFERGRMHLLVEGLNYRGAPLSVRERVFLSGEALRGWLERLGAKPALTGGAILSTCNRTEFYLTAEDPERARGELEELTRDFDPRGEVGSHAYQLQGTNGAKAPLQGAGRVGQRHPR